MNEQYSNGRPWASAVHAAVTKPRHKFGVDGRLLLVPIIFPCALAVPFGRDFAHQALFALVAALLWLAAKIAWEFNPYLLDDLAAEMRHPRVLTDDVRTR